MSSTSPDRTTRTATRPLRHEVSLLSAADLAMLGWLALVVVAYVPDFAYPTWSSRGFLVVAVVPLGLWRLASLAYRRDRSAQLLTILLVVLAASSLAGGNPYESLIGGEPTGQSVLFWCALAAVWALGRTGSSAVRRAAAPVVVVCVGLHLVIAAIQLALQIESGPFAIASGRPSGLATNPVYFGALAAMGTVYLAHRSLRSDQLVWALAAAVYAAFVTLSGSRAAVVATVVVMAVLAVGRPTRSIVRAGLTVAGGLVAGSIVGWAIGTSSAAERSITGTSGGRTDAWTAAWKAFLERPLLGWGPNRFRIAIQGRLPDEFVTAVDVSGAHSWTDPHNIVVSLAVGAGVVGVVVAILFAWQASVGADRVLLACVATVALTWLLQPVYIVTGPVAFFLFGAAKTVDFGPSKLRYDRFLVPLTLAVGLLAGTTYAVLDASVARAPDLFEEADAWRSYRHDAGVADRLAERYALYALGDFPYLSDEALSWGETAVSYDPDRATWWGRLSYWQLLFGDSEAAERSSAEALRLQPNEPQAWLVRRALAAEGSDARLAAEERVCTLVPDQC